MKILLSIKPEYADKILNGQKKYEFRKVIFKDKRVNKVIIYATMPVGKVIGEFEIEDILQDLPTSIWKETKEFSGITHKFFSEYFNGRNKAFAIKVKNPFKYNVPVELSSIVKNGIPPQSFCYLE